MSLQIFHFNQPFRLESGQELPGYHLAYTLLGSPEKHPNKVVWIFHALTANSDPSDWWPGLVGEGKLFDPREYAIVCVNMPGSCYGSIGPLDTDPATGQPWYHRFPLFTTRDMIRAYQPLRAHLGIEKIHIGLGGSMGGQQLLEWAIEEPHLFEHIIPIATNAQHSPWGIAFNASQRMCIETDPSWKQADPEAGREGMKVARSLALLSYRHYDAYNQTQPRDKKAPVSLDHPFGGDAAESYQRYQGEKLAKRFNAFSYYRLSQAMDSHDLARGRQSIVHALAKIKAHTLSIGISSDLLFPPSEQVTLAQYIPEAKYACIDSSYGHDGFLLEYEKLEKLVREFVRKKENY